MAQESVFRGIIFFLEKVGVYDVILPFLLVFTIMFAILEKTKVLGTEKFGEKTYPKRNLNAMAAFVIGFFVIASTQLVALINEAMSNVVILVLVGVSFLILVGLFQGDNEVSFKDKPEMAIIIVLMALGVIFIFLHAIPVGDSNVLNFVLAFIALNWQADWVGAIILVVFLIGMMMYITNPQKGPKEEKKKE